MTGFADTDLTCDGYLGGLVHLWQPRSGYRAGVDPVLLAASVPAVAGQSVLDMGCGVGTAALCLHARVPGLVLTGVEISADLAGLARRNGGDGLEVVEADIDALPGALRQRQFDHVIANPPYFDRAASRPSDDPLRETAHGEGVPLSRWIAVAAKRLRPKGMLHIIQRADRLAVMLRVLPDDLGSVQVLPIAARIGRDPDRVVLRARKNGRGAFRLHAPRVMHQGAQHESDLGDDYSPEIRAILRQGAALEF